MEQGKTEWSEVGWGRVGQGSLDGMGWCRMVGWGREGKDGVG